MTLPSMNVKAYLDHNATTPIWETLYEEVPKWMKSWGNPSSIHQTGRAPKNILREARKQIAEYLQVSPLEIVFNSGASEGNNTVIKGLAEKILLEPMQHRTEKCEFMCSTVEHPSVLKTYQWLENKGLKVHWIPVNQDGELSLDFYEQHLSEKVLLVSVMGANNETGNVFPIAKLCQLAHQKGALFHCDGTQLMGKAEFDFTSMNVDYATFSGHKFYALKGIGFLYIKKNLPYTQLIHGGAQERYRRSGTENTFGIASMGYMLELMAKEKNKILTMQLLRDDFEKQVLQRISDVRITGAKAPRLANTSHMMIDGVDGETLLMNLDLEGFPVSTGAACSSGNPEPSPVLLSMGFTRDQAQSSLRVSLGWGTEKQQLDLFVETLEKIVKRLREIKHGQKYFN
ncbi:MAG: cysteine desulfurase [Bdellovibrionaceae bacterium]|nr:cysteine desulfurase [Pseudobdellovibrionaceae bacterium]